MHQAVAIMLVRLIEYIANINYTKRAKTVKASITINKNNIEEVKR